MNRRSFLKVLIGGVAVAALPALPRQASTLPALSYSEIIRQFLNDGPARRTYLVIPVRQWIDGVWGESDAMIYPLEADKWAIREGVARYSESIEFHAQDTIEIRDLYIVDDAGRAIFPGQLSERKSLMIGDVICLQGLAASFG